MAFDYYSVLGLGRDASLSQIERAFRTLSHQMDHDPHAEGAESRLAQVREAYRILSDTAQRAEYERKLRQPEAPPAPRPHVRESLTYRPVELFRDFEHYRPGRDSLWEHWGQNFDPAHAPKARTVKDVNVEVLISTDHAARGGVITLQVPVGELCARCQGTGSTGYFACDCCDGHGMRWEDQRVDVMLTAPVRDGTIIPVSLKHLGIKNLHLNLTVRVAPQ